jgi:hypothetical protein
VPIRFTQADRVVRTIAKSECGTSTAASFSYFVCVAVIADVRPVAISDADIFVFGSSPQYCRRDKRTH